MSILLLSDLKKSTRTIIRGKSKTPKTLPALIIRGKKIVQFSKKRPSALIRGRAKLEKLRYHIPELTLDIFPFPVAAQDIFLCPTTHWDSAFGPIIWNLISKEIKNCDTLASFVSKIRQGRPNACPCRICKNFIPNVGFIETN